MRSALLTAAVVGAPGTAVGQTPEPPGSSSVAPPQPSATQPPRLIAFVEAPYPDGARGIEATVVLRLTIDAAGGVTEAEVTQPAGGGFDEAARTAALRFRFEPAQRNGKPVASRILYRYSFKPPVEVAPQPPKEQATAEEPKKSEPAPARKDVAAPKAGTQAKEPVEVTVHGQLSEVEERRQSAEAVTVVETRRARQRSVDMGEVLNSSQGVNVRRSGSLGSVAVVCLNGLCGDQLRYYFDGVPLEFAGFPLGIIHVPVNMIQHIDIYQGMVPIRFGGDAVGGAVNIASDPVYDTAAGGSYEVGSFGTHRATADARYRHDPSGFVAGAGAFLDYSRNDYRIDVQIPDEKGRPVPANVRRFHDAYTGLGGVLEAGFVDRRWAKRTLLRLFGTMYDKELQHGVNSVAPFGEVTYGASTVGAVGRYEQPLSDNLDIVLLAGYRRQTFYLLDKAEWIYDWHGARGLPRRKLGELGRERPIDATIWDDGVLGRAYLSWAFAPSHIVRFNLSPTFTTRTGENREFKSGERDALSARVNLFKFVGGIEHELNLFGDRLQNIASVKGYVLSATSDEVLAPGAKTRRFDQQLHRFGLGDGARFRFSPWAYAKISYEYATRLPRTDEMFGDGVLIAANPTLVPEVSHNGNIGPRIELKRTPAGSFVLDINAFLRDSDDLIHLVGNSSVFTYKNVGKIRALGAEGGISWTSPGRWLAIDANATFQDVRIASAKGFPACDEDERLPNQPWLFGNAEARFESRPQWLPNDRLTPFYAVRYVHDFFITCEKIGIRALKAQVPSQLTHGLGLSYAMQRIVSITSTLEVQNITDADTFDYYKIQKPGRSIFFKSTLEY